MKKCTCEGCGRTRSRNRMIRRQLNGRVYYCCSLPCEVKWEKTNLLGVCG